MPLDTDRLASMYAAWRARYEERDVRIDTIDRVIKGEFDVFDPDEEGIDSKSPNLIQVALEDTPGAAASFTQVDITAEGDLRLQDASGGQFVALEAPSTIGSSYTLELPAADGSNGQLLKTNGSGALSFTDPPSSGTSRSETFFMGLL